MITQQPPMSAPFSWREKENAHELCLWPLGYIYDPAVGDPDNGVEPGTEFKDLPADWVCPSVRHRTNSVRNKGQEALGASLDISLPTQKNRRIF